MIKLKVERKNFRFNDHNRTISYDIHFCGKQSRARQNTETLSEKEYFKRKLAGK